MCVCIYIYSFYTWLKKKKVITFERLYHIPVLDYLPKEAYIPTGPYSSTKICVYV